MKTFTKNLILILATTLALSALLSSCGEIIGEISESIETSEEAVDLTELAESSNNTTNTTAVTTNIADEVPESTISETEKYPKKYDTNGELIVYWLESGSVWHESAKCSTIINADSAKIHIGTANEAYSNGKERACKTCSSDSTVVIPETTKVPETTRIPETTRTQETTRTPETTKAPETTRIPETTKTPDTTSAPETTRTPETTRVTETTKTPESTSNPEDARTVYWVTEGYVWHYSKDCWTLDDSLFIYSGYATDAKAIGKERACKVCADGSTIETPETTIDPEITTAPEETVSPSTDEGITIVSWPVTASRNEVVSVTVHGKANTQYYIEVNYKSGPSTSKDLNPKISDSNGDVTWTWKVGRNSSAGTFDIIVKDDEGKSVKVEWTVVVD